MGMIAPAGQQDPLGLVLVVHLLERHGGFTSSYRMLYAFSKLNLDRWIRIRISEARIIRRTVAEMQ